jgi:far upstream element-binding protein
VNTGSVSIDDALAKARNFAAGKGISYDSDRNGGMKKSRRLSYPLPDIHIDSRDGRSYRHSRSRSRSPPRRDTYTSYRDERRDDRRGGYGRDRSRSPARGGRSVYSPQPGRNFGRDRSPRRDDGDSEVISIDSNLVGLVIGRSGENLRRVEQETSARIQFITPPDHPGPQRQCRISGTLRARNDAKQEIFRIIEENNATHRDSTRGSSNASRQQPPQQQQQQQGTKLPSQPVLREGENSMQIMVPDRTVGLIIGRGGETIRDLQDRSGCHINIVGANKSVNGLRPVNLIGSVQAASKAKDLIMEIVESDTRGPQGQNDTPSQAPPMTMNTRPSNQDNQGKISETIKVPSDAVGMIIGKGGETIKEMQNSTACKINVTQASGHGADIEREIGLVGDRHSIEAAKKAIWEKVDMVVRLTCKAELQYTNSFVARKE